MQTRQCCLLRKLFIISLKQEVQGSTKQEEPIETAIAIGIIGAVVFFWVIWSIKGKNNNGRGGRNGGGGPFIFWGNPGHLNDSFFGRGFSGGSFGGGSFGGGGAGGGW